MYDIHLPPFFYDSIKQGGIDHIIFAFIWNITMNATLIACISYLNMNTSKKFVWTYLSTSAVIPHNAILDLITTARPRSVLYKLIRASINRLATTEKTLIYKQVEKLRCILFQHFILNTSENLRQLSDNIIY